MSKGIILLIDDNQHLRVTLSDHLTHEGYEVQCAQSGEEGLEQLERSKPDLIILDINMPGMGGVGFVRRILGADGKPKNPVLVLTARSAVGEFFQTVEVEGFLTKPCPMSEMLKRIEEVITRLHGRARREGVVTVLIAEDDLVVADRLMAVFGHAGLVVQVARSGTEVLDKAPALRPALILLKQVLSRMNGNILVPLLAAMPSTRDIPVILYDESRRHQSIGGFVENLPPGVTRFISSQEPEELLRLAKVVLNRE
jgi:CheY-like chemotaxis protein